MLTPCLPRHTSPSRSPSRPFAATPRHRLGASLAWIGLSCALSSGVWAQTPPQPGLEDAACSAAAGHATSARARLQHLLGLHPLCQKNADFLVELGQSLNANGQYLEAADHLERALMLEPQLKAAQLSYAVALAGNGDAPAALALLDQLLAEPELPPALRAQIDGYRNQLAPPLLGSAWQQRISLAGRVGYDSNLLGAPNLTSMNLTLADITLQLPLDASYLAHGGAYTRADAQLDLQRRSDDGGRWEVSASLRNRSNPSVSKADSSQVDILVERNFIETANQWGGGFANITASALRSGAGTRYQTRGLAVGWGVVRTQSESAVCQLRVGVETQQRSYFDNDLLSGRYKGLSALGLCEWGRGPQWLFGIKDGLDQAQTSARAGGNQVQRNLRLAINWPIGTLLSNIFALGTASQSGRLLADYEQNRHQDVNSYSPLLDSGRTRTIDRHSLKIEYQKPVAPAMQWIVGLEKTAQSSSLVLFRQYSWGVFTGVRGMW